MLSEQTLILINVASIIFLVIMMAILMAATRMKGSGGWAALVIVTTTVPVYLSNMMREIGAAGFLASLYPAMTLNALCMPALWLFTRSQLDRSFRFTWKTALHGLPALVSLAATLVFYAPLSPEQVEAERLFLNDGGENLPAVINDVIIFGQFFIYFIVIFIYIRRKWRFLRDNYSDSDFLTIRWIPKFLFIFFLLFLTVFVAYVINPRIDVWLIPILNVIGMSYLTYNVIFHSTQPYFDRIPAEKTEREKPSGSSAAMSGTKMETVCDKVMNYLTASRAYTDPGFSLSMLSAATGIHQKTISTAINGYLHKNFFELVNGLRVDEAKRLLLDVSRSHYTVESVYADCGFRSRTTFFVAFKKAEGRSPALWLKESAAWA